MTEAEMTAKALACDELASRLHNETDRKFMRDAAEQWRMMLRQIAAIREDAHYIRGA